MASTRFAFQVELYGLNQGARTQFINDAQAALAGRNVSVGETPTLDANKDIKGDVCAFIEATFSTRADVDLVFNAVVSRARQTGAVTNASGRPSYVRMRSMDLNTDIVTQMYAEAPGWVAVETTEA
jgi:hypothetical protein